MTFEEAKQQAIDRSEWVLCHGAGYYTARTPDGRDIIGKGENGVFVGGEYRPNQSRCILAWNETA